MPVSVGAERFTAVAVGDAPGGGRGETLRALLPYRRYILRSFRAASARYETARRH